MWVTGEYGCHTLVFDDVVSTITFDDNVCQVVTSVCNESARAAALSELVVRLVNESLTEFAYAAFVTELEYSLKATDAGFQVI